MQCHLLQPKSIAPYGRRTTGIASVDSMGSKLNQLSIEERDNALHDLHGVANPIEETPEMIKAKLREMSFALLSLIAECGEDTSLGYRKAVFKSPDYVEKLKLSFLRAESFQTQQASQRMMRFFNLKLELFGEEKITDDITFADLAEDEQEVVRQGLCHLLPERDRAGRSIFFINGTVMALVPQSTNLSRALFYFLMAVTQEEETQIKGMVGISYALGTTEHAKKSRLFEYIKLVAALPWRPVGRHLCREANWKFSAFSRILVKALEGRHLSRLRVHVGTHTECMYNLMTFGIPREAVPVLDDGSVDLSHHQRLLQHLRDKEDWGEHLELVVSSANPPTQEDSEPSIINAQNAILVPGPMDVLMGRGYQPTSRPGLLRMHQLLESYLAMYEAQPRNSKKKVARMVFADMKKLGCRFLSPTKTGGYVESDEAVAVEKISHGFRNLRGKSKNTPRVSDVPRGRRSCSNRKRVHE